MVEIGTNERNEPILTDDTIQDQVDYQPCGYKGTRLKFRGPRRTFDAPYVAVLGGSETFGPFVQHPFPELLEDLLDQPVVNLGVREAGVSLFASEDWLIDRAARADITVFQILGAANMSNRLYSVHSRRNDRFLAVSSALRDLYPGVDFTDFNFIRHLLQSLSQISEDSFGALVEELRWAWMQRMRRLVGCIPNEVVLLWLSERRPEDPGIDPDGPGPLFVTREMVDAIAQYVSGVVEVVYDATEHSLDGKLFCEEDASAASATIGPRAHAEVAEELYLEIMNIRGRQSLGKALTQKS